MHGAFLPVDGLPHPLEEDGRMACRSSSIKYLAGVLLILILLGLTVDSEGRG